MRTIDDRINWTRKMTQSPDAKLRAIAERNLRILDGERTKMLVPAPRWKRPQPVQETDPAWLSWAALMLLAALCAALFLNRSPEPTWTSGGYDQAIQSEVSE